jgi:AraC-like DNA-binding protein
MFLTFQINYLMFSIYFDQGGLILRKMQALARFGISLRELQDFHGYISLRDFVGIFEWLARNLRDPSLGLKVAQRSGPDALGAVGYLFLSSGTLETALQSLIRYLEAIQSSSAMELHYFDKFAEVRYGIVDNTIVPRRQDSEYSIGLIWRYMKLLSKNKCRLTQVSFEHGLRPGHHSVYRRVFNAPVLFNQDANVLTLPLAEIREWREGLDPHLIPILEDHIATTLSQSSGPETFAETVTVRLTDSMLGQGARAELVAEELGISTATLHRKLRLEGFRFKELVELRCKEVAKRHLRHSNIPIGTISPRLGFSDPATFSRACRRWFGKTPSDLRKETRKKLAMNRR